MKQSEIVIGETYLFVATDSQARKHLEGQPFTVTKKEAVFRKVYRKGARKVNRFFNLDGIGARAEELGELPASEFNKCPECKDVTKVSDLKPNAHQMVCCDNCGAFYSPEWLPMPPLPEIEF